MIKYSKKHLDFLPKGKNCDFANARIARLLKVCTHNSCAKKRLTISNKSYKDYLRYLILQDVLLGIEDDIPDILPSRCELFGSGQIKINNMRETFWQD